ncbi:MAG TPA: T9SS type A sorting domain-containing protein [Chitinophagaceae bacterium]|nr:T9SS type A sorting domain-containing protein [Chitinophagaceae bacterium]
MKKTVPIFLLLLPFWLSAQITTPIIKANFGVDADLRANYFNGAIMAGNDDWFNNGTGGSGAFIIDTTGAADRVARYATDVAYRRLPFSAGMRYPQFSVINNRLLYDAYFYRDYHGDDSTIFAAGSNKNGMSPANWTTPVSQSVPDKNEILDAMMHIRRAGPNTSDSLWLFGGVSIENVTGNRYFDFEMFQTELTYNRATLNFSNYGPDAGHTTWQFDAGGNVTQVGDIIFTAEYSSSSLSLVEARIWINQSSLSITPVNFNWGGLFDGAGAGATYGYASITPKTSGVFYTGLQCVNNTWTGPFSLVIGTNTLQTNYVARQYMEFSVNLTKIGLDPAAAILGGSLCGLPFRRVLIKSRASTSFTSELKDFILPFDFFRAPKAKVQATIPLLCGPDGLSDIFVTNPLATSIYTWSTNNGNIVSPTTGTVITVDSPGTYYVEQRLLSSCSPYAMDSVTITSDPLCGVLACNFIKFNAFINGKAAQLNWEAVCQQNVNYFEVERSTDGIHFLSISRVQGSDILNKPVQYTGTDNLAGIYSSNVYYRLKAVSEGEDGESKKIAYSRPIKLSLSNTINPKIRITPNPVVNSMQIIAEVAYSTNVQLKIFSGNGRLVREHKTSLLKGTNSFVIDGLKILPQGLYHAVFTIDKDSYAEKVMIGK